MFGWIAVAMVFIVWVAIDRRIRQRAASRDALHRLEARRRLRARSRSKPAAAVAPDGAEEEPND